MKSKRGNWLNFTIVVCAVALIGHDLYCRKLSTDLDAALGTPSWPSVQRLLQRGVPITTEVQYMQALTMAAQQGDASCLKTLFDQKSFPLTAIQTSTLLDDAVSSRNPNAVRVLLKHGADPNRVVNKSYPTPLAYATGLKNTGVIEVLRSNGAHMSPFEAAKYGDYEELKNALDSKVNPNLADVSGQTLLSLAAENGSVPCIQLLLKQGAKVDVESRYLGQRETALITAARADKLETVQALLEAGADINARSHSSPPAPKTNTGRGATTVSAASFTTQRPSADMTSINPVTGSSALIEAAKSGNVEVVAFLLQHGADVKAHTSDGNTALLAALSYQIPPPQKHASNSPGFGIGYSMSIHPPPNPVIHPSEPDPRTIKAGHADIARMLMLAGADVKASSASSTVLCTACQNRYDSLVPLLLAHGADIDQAAPDGNTPLMCALGRWNYTFASGSVEPIPSDESLARYLIAQGAKVNTQNSHGLSPLMFAAEYYDVEAARSLLDRRANIDALSKDGSTVLDFAYANLPGQSQAARSRIIALLREHKAHLTFMEAAQNGDLIDLQWHIDRGANVNGSTSYTLYGLPGTSTTQTWQGFTALAAASWSGHPEAVSLLIDHGATLEATDSRGWTALMYAADRDQADTVRMLLERGAKIEGKDYRGWSALMIAAAAGSKQATQVLLDHHADVHTTNRKGQGVIEIAKSRGRREIIPILRHAGASD